LRRSRADRSSTTGAAPTGPFVRPRTPARERPRDDPAAHGPAGLRRGIRTAAAWPSPPSCTAASTCAAFWPTPPRHPRAWWRRTRTRATGARRSVRRLFYVEAGRLEALPYEVREGAFRPASAATLFELGPLATTFDVSPDGEGPRERERAVHARPLPRHRGDRRRRDG
jgi:hypothetical protein